jgi:mycoredoxin
MNKVKNIKMYSTSWCGDCFRAKKFFENNDINYEEIDIEDNPKYAKKVEEINDGNRSVPTIIIEMENEEEKIMVEPSHQELEDFFKD